MFSFSSISMKLPLGIAGYKAVKEDDVRRAYVNTGMWPMDFRFLKWATDKLAKKEMEHEKVHVERARHTMNIFKEVLSSRSIEEPPTSTFNELAKIIQ